MRIIVIVLCRIAMPLLTILALIIAPPLVNPSSQPSSLAWVIRVLLTSWLCASYWQLPNVYANNGKIWNINLTAPRSDASRRMIQLAFIWNAIGFSTVIGIITGWALSITLPSLGPLHFVIAISNGLFFVIFMLSGLRNLKIGDTPNA